MSVDVTDATNAMLDNSGHIWFNRGMSETLVKTCHCGCGAEVKKRYLPGHDAKHKSALVSQANTACTRQAADRAIRQLIERDWTQYADLEVLRGFVFRYRGRPQTHRSQITTWLIGPDNTHHARHGCSQLTQAAKTAGHRPHPITRLAPQAAIRREANTGQEIGWDGCPECTCENTLDELVETWLIGRTITLDAYDSMGWTKLGNHKPSHRKHQRVEATEPPAPHVPSVVPNHQSRHPQRRM